MISFTNILKNDLCKLDNNEIENIALLSALIKNTSAINEKISIITENAAVSRLVFNLMKDMYGIIAKVIVRKGYNFKRSYIYILEINQKKELIINDLNINEVIPKEYLIEDEEAKRAYLRGLFLACGSINDPKKSRYHLEFLVDEEEYAKFLLDLLNSFDLNSKYIKKDNKYMIYIKEAEKIGDFLRIIKAHNAVMYYEDIRIYRDHKNMTNRLNNCEQANIDKVIMNATKEVKDIELIINNGGLDLLDEKEQIVAKYRLKYPETSLQELSEIISLETEKPITKSGLHHRLKKIKELAERIKNVEKNKN